MVKLLVTSVGWGAVAADTAWSEATATAQGSSEMRRPVERSERVHGLCRAGRLFGGGGDLVTLFSSEATGAAFGPFHRAFRAQSS
ncbi:hypothetical protein CRI70_31400 [Streptomyces sp. Ru87]|nr:hypothetical protein CRI70_31400 [Streptomyces sp. Ru87]